MNFWTLSTPRCGPLLLVRDTALALQLVRLLASRGLACILENEAARTAGACR